MDEYGKMGPHRHKRGRMKGRLALIGVVVIVILVAAFAYFFLGGPINVSGPTTLTINNKGTVFALAGQSYVATLASYNNYTQTAYVYVSSVPVFLGPVINVTLRQNSTVKVNYGGQYAIMQMVLLSGSKNSAQVQVAPLALSLQISPDYQYIGHPTVQLPGLAVTTTVAATTTVSAGSGNNSVSTTSATTTAASTTTTVPSTNYTRVAIETAANGDANFALLSNFSTLYNNTVNCTPHVYNLSYFDQFGAFPVPPLDYANVSYETPYSMTQTIVYNTGTSYSVKFLPSVRDPGFNGKSALTINLTVTGAGSSSAIAIVKSDTYGGIFEGAQYNDLRTQYQQSKANNNACGVMVG